MKDNVFYGDGSCGLFVTLWVNGELLASGEVRTPDIEDSTIIAAARGFAAGVKADIEPAQEVGIAGGEDLEFEVGGVFGLRVEDQIKEGDRITITDRGDSTECIATKVVPLPEGGVRVSVKPASKHQ